MNARAICIECGKGVSWPKDNMCDFCYVIWLDSFSKKKILSESSSNPGLLLDSSRVSTHAVSLNTKQTQVSADG